jgi:hypothetical protein
MYSAWIFFPLLALFSIVGCASKHFQMLTRVEEHYPSASLCGKCHTDIYAEWKESAHAKSYSNDAFRLATNGYSFKDCLGCHSPVSIYAAGVPAARNAISDEGVTCVSCHFKQGRLTGPIDPTATIVPHAIDVEKEFYTTSELCGTCHQGTYDEWRQAKVEDKKTCQDCHMPEVERKVTQATDFLSKVLVSMEEEHKLKRHTFDYRKIDKPKEAVSFAVKWEREEDGFFADVVVQSRAPHSIPTGDFGFRKAIVAMTARSGDGKILSQQSVDLYKETKSALKPMERRSFHFSLPGDASRIEIALKREGQNETNRFVIGEFAFSREETK